MGNIWDAWREAKKTAERASTFFKHTNSGVVGLSSDPGMDPERGLSPGTGDGDCCIPRKKLWQFHDDDSSSSYLATVLYERREEIKLYFEQNDPSHVQDYLTLIDQAKTYLDTARKHNKSSVIPVNDSIENAFTEVVDGLEGLVRFTRLKKEDSFFDQYAAHKKKLLPAFEKSVESTLPDDKGYKQLGELILKVYVMAWQVARYGQNVNGFSDESILPYLRICDSLGYNTEFTPLPSVSSLFSQ